MSHFCFLLIDNEKILKNNPQLYIFFQYPIKIIELQDILKTDPLKIRENEFFKNKQYYINKIIYLTNKLIPNDKNFQIASRLIGVKGNNMKNIINECTNNNNAKDSLKLRLRGRGSGYKEGFNNKESDEPLHLCISAKNKEEMNKACILVEKLLNKIYDDYKAFCIKNNIFPILNKLAIKIDSGNYFQKNK